MITSMILKGGHQRLTSKNKQVINFGTYIDKSKQCMQQLAQQTKLNDQGQFRENICLYQI